MVGELFCRQRPDSYLFNQISTHPTNGHSNTTPGLAGMLAEQPMEDLDERVYDHIYKVTVDDAGKATLNIDFSEPHTPLPESDGSTP